MIILLSGHIVSAEEIRCGSHDIIVKYSSAADVTDVCEGVSDAIRFLEANGVKKKGGFTINIVQKIQTSLPIDILAKYNLKTNQIDILSLERFLKLKKKTLFGLKIDSILYRSFIVHEATHAIVLQNIQSQQSSRAAQEYIAYTVQLATLPIEYQKKILERYQIDGFNNDEEINMVLYCLDPDSFAVMAYKHFLRAENGAAFYTRILNGELQLDEEFYLICR